MTEKRKLGLYVLYSVTLLITGIYIYSYYKKKRKIIKETGEDIDSNLIFKDYYYVNTLRNPLPVWNRDNKNSIIVTTLPRGSRICTGEVEGNPDWVYVDDDCNYILPTGYVEKKHLSKTPIDYTNYPPEINPYRQYVFNSDVTTVLNPFENKKITWKDYNKGTKIYGRKTDNPNWIEVSEDKIWGQQFIEKKYLTA